MVRTPPGSADRALLPGIGGVTARTLTTNRVELGQINHGRIAVPFGVAPVCFTPVNRNVGRMRGHHAIACERIRVCKVVFAWRH